MSNFVVQYISVGLTLFVSRKCGQIPFEICFTQFYTHKNGNLKVSLVLQDIFLHLSLSLFKQ